VFRGSTPPLVMAAIALGCLAHTLSVLTANLCLTAKVLSVLSHMLGLHAT
jgi:hypothetical protein